MSPGITSLILQMPLLVAISRPNPSQSFWGMETFFMTSPLGIISELKITSVDVTQPDFAKAGIV